mgnify:FL=1
MCCVPPSPQALKTILVTSLQNEGVAAGLVRVQTDSPELQDAKKFELKLAAAQGEMLELRDKHTVGERGGGGGGGGRCPTM